MHNEAWGGRVGGVFHSHLLVWMCSGIRLLDLQPVAFRGKKTPASECACILSSISWEALCPVSALLNNMELEELCRKRLKFSQ